MTPSPWLSVAHSLIVFAVLTIMAQAVVIIVTGDVFGPAVFAAGAAFTIAVLFWSEWRDAIDELLPD